ncbi:MAG: hypothetical protein FI709_12720 [SAR202 cluster bacterium]|jgi:hypothetical protein|nr:C4-type zinc ribbon domain-containing protein [SAR202 cluster bacterium]MQG58767.1 hypothetical protein [SAR202 cluster bacterium]|tara:strand:- start:13472 stop:14173 length:702 start_codon:yes stop_codon:yes gene_type:complete
MFSVRQLYDLQLLDWDIQSHEQELADVNGKLADDSERIAAKNLLAGLETKLGELGPAGRLAEGAVQQTEQRLAAIDTRVYSGMITNPRELEAIEDEKAALQQQHSEQEDTLLTIMVDTDETQENKDRAQAKFESINSHREEELVELQASRETLTAELPLLHERREDMVVEYPPIAMATYDTVAKMRGGQAVALVERDTCQGCRIALARSELQAIRSNQNIVQCGSCSRILVVN